MPASKPVSVAQPGICANCSVVIVSINLLRPDHLGVNGYYRNATPNIDAFVKEGFFFNNTFAQSGWTLPSYASFWTSTYPQFNGVNTRKAKLSSRFATLPEVFQLYGYETAAFTSDFFDVGYKNGLMRGFNLTVVEPTSHWNPTSDVSLRVPWIKDWLLENGRYKRPFLIFVDSFYLHCLDDQPSDPRNVFFKSLKNSSSRENSTGLLLCNPSSNAFGEANKVVANYDWRLKEDDAGFGELRSMLDELGVSNKTILVLLSPHGDDFNEHGFFGHGLLFDTNLRAMLVIKVPGYFGNRTTPELAELVDVMPTVLDLVGLKAPHTVQGASLAPFIFGKNWEGKGAVFASQTLLYGNKQFNHLLSIRARNEKYLLNAAGWSKFDLGADPGELRGVRTELPEEYSNFLRETGGWAGGSIFLTKYDFEKLKNEGYFEVEEKTG